MKKFYFIFTWIFFSQIFFAAADSLNSTLLKSLKQLPGATITEIEHDSSFVEAYKIMLEQPLDHLNPFSGKKFRQRIFLYNKDESLPVVFVTEGYSAREGTIAELTKIIGCNQITVEHRFFGDSVPDSLEWKYLTTAQAAADHHTISALLKKIYRGKWISTGISKGGQTTIFYKYYYPNDVDVWVPYVAPLNLEREDHRIHSFLDQVGAADCRAKIYNFQRAVLKHEKPILSILKDNFERDGKPVVSNLELNFEYAVLEYPFSFWQWGYATCDEIPDANSSNQVLYEHLNKVSSFNYAGGIGYFLPFFYQAYTEIGYYNYETEPFKDLLTQIKGEYASNIIYAPQNTELNYDASLMKNINDFLQTNGNNMLYIYGGLDPWSSTGVVIGAKTNAVKMVKEDGYHWTRIRHFDEIQKEKIYSTFENWLNIKIKR